MKSTCDVLTEEVAKAVEKSVLAMERCAQHDVKSLITEHEAKMHEAPVVPQGGVPVRVAMK